MNTLFHRYTQVLFIICCSLIILLTGTSVWAAWKTQWKTSPGQKDEDIFLEELEEVEGEIPLEPVEYIDEKVDDKGRLKYKTRIIRTGMEYEIWTYSYHPNGNIHTENYRAADKISAYMRIFHENGVLELEENYKSGKKQGASNAYYISDKPRHSYNYREGEKDGINKDYFRNGKLRLETNYRLGKIEGIQKEFKESGKIYAITNYRNGKKYGLRKEYDDIGEIKIEKTYKDDVLNGPYKEYYPDRVRRVVGKFVDGKRNGVFSFFSSDGSLVSKVPYADGDFHKIIKEYYSNGKIKQEVEILKKKKGLCTDWTTFSSVFDVGCFISNEFVEGRLKIYDEKGFLNKELPYKNGKINGVVTEHQNKGEIEIEIDMKDSVMEGSVRRYRKGRLEFEQKYHKGQIVSEVHYNKKGKRIYEGNYGTDFENRLFDCKQQEGICFLYRVKADGHKELLQRFDGDSFPLGYQN